MKAIFQTQVAPMIASVSPEPANAAMRAGLVSSQLLGVAICRYVLRLPPVRALDREQIVANIGPTLQRYLTEPLG